MSSATPAPSRAPSRVGVIGLGLLGSALAERLLMGGFAISVYDHHPEKGESLVAQGARWSPEPLAECDRVVLCLYTSAVVDQVLTQFAGVLRPGQIVIDTTTGNPADMVRIGRQLAEQGVDYLEAPIVASSEQVRSGTGSALVSGPEPVYHACRDLFDAMVATTHYVGAWGDAAKTKLVNNLILGLNRAALAEGLSFAKSIGLDLGATLGVLRQSNSYSGAMDTKGDKMVEREFAPQGKLAQHAKDVRLILELAEAHGQGLPLSKLHLSLLNDAIDAGWGELDNSAIIHVIEGLNLLADKNYG